MRIASRVLIAVVWLLALPLPGRGESIPVAEQNALVQRHCAVCHTDAARNGGLSLQRFDAANAPPSLVAMMVSKVTTGLALSTVQAAPADAKAAELVTKRVVGGAMFAAGIQVPIPTIASFATSLATLAVDPGKWHVSRAQDPAATGVVTMLSALRELPSLREGDVAPSYRLVLTCNETTREGEMQVAWSPVPKNGTLLVAVDGGAPSPHTVDGVEKMGDGTGGTTGRAALSIVRTMPEARAAAELPARSLAVSGLFPGETATFSFDDLPAGARQALGRCFTGR
jgi:hypothetical protein